MGVRLKPETANKGFDTAAGQDSQTIPVLEERVIIVSGGDAANKPVSSDEGVAKIKSYVPFGGSYKLILSGVAKGSATITWDTSTAKKAKSETLDVSVRSQRLISTGFRFVTMSGGRATTRALGSIDKMILDANAILQPQANVKIVNVSELACDLTAMGARAATGELSEISALQNDLVMWRVNNKLIQQEFEVWFVPEVESKKNNGDSTQAAVMRGTSICFYEDDVSPLDEGAVLAHEMCHAFGRTGHSRNSGHLMYTTSNKTRMPKTLADLLNPV